MAMAMAMASSQVARTCRMESREGRKKGQLIVAKRDEEKKVPPTRDEPARRIGRPAGREGRVRVRGSRRVQVPRQIAGGELVDSCNPFPAQQWAHPHPPSPIPDPISSKFPIVNELLTPKYCVCGCG